MNAEDNNDSTDVEKLLQRQRAPATSEPLPAMPDDLRQQWSAHFGPQRRVIQPGRRVWAAGLAAAAAAIVVIGFVCFEGSPSKPGSESPHEAVDTTPGLRAISADGDPTPPLSPIAQALLHYHDSSTAGFYVRE